MKYLSICLTSAAVILSTPANAQLSSRWLEGRGAMPPRAEGASPEYRRLNDGAFAAWQSEEDERNISRSYGMALQFAECVARFNRGTAGLVLAESIAGRPGGIKLRRIAEANPGCALEHRKVHPLLLRAALAETLLEGKSEAGATAQKAASSVGVPEVVDGYPLGLISRCQASIAPKMVAGLLSTEPGEQAEHDAAERLFATTPACGATKLGRLTATAARLALIEASYRETVKAGARQR